MNRHGILTHNKAVQVAGENAALNTGVGVLEDGQGAAADVDVPLK
jgi:hypothetical protein